MKKFAVLILATLFAPPLVPVVHGIEQGGANAMERFADKRMAESRSSHSRRIARNDPAAIAKLISDINAAARTNKERMLSIIVINTNIAATTLEQERARTGLTIGDIYVAHALSLATKKKFNAIIDLHKSGKTWADIARSHNVSLRGSDDLIREMKKG